MLADHEEILPKKGHTSSKSASGSVITNPTSNLKFYDVINIHIVQYGGNNRDNIIGHIAQL